MKFYLLKQAVVGPEVPATVFDNLLRARGDELKVILHVIKTGQTDDGEISAALGISRNRVLSRMTFWADKGLILRERDEKTAGKRERKSRMTSRQILKVSRTRPEIALLVNRMQKIYGKALSEKATNSFVSLYVEEGVPVDVILILSTYYAPRQKGPGYTARVILNLFDKNGIDTAEKAERHVELLMKREYNHNTVCAVFGLDPEKLTSGEKTMIDSWNEKLGMSIEMIRAAADRAGLNAGIRYCNGILKSWSQKGYARPEDIREIPSALSASPEITPENDAVIKGMDKVPVFRKDD